jgi:Uma2 family endonuclease
MGFAAVLVPVEEYLQTSFSPDCDFVEGILKERNVGSQVHSASQVNAAFRLKIREAEWGIRVLAEQRIRVRPKRYRIADLCVVRAADPWEPVVGQAPLLCVEVLSEGDRIVDLEDRIEDYLAMGVAIVWIVDPQHRRGWHVLPHNRQEPADGILRVPGTPIEVPVADIFQGLP